MCTAPRPSFPPFFAADASSHPRHPKPQTPFSSFLGLRRRLSLCGSDTLTLICTVANALRDSHATALAFSRQFATAPTMPVAVIRLLLTVSIAAACSEDNDDEDVEDEVEAFEARKQRKKARRADSDDD
jgi:hypothetical protein